MCSKSSQFSAIVPNQPGVFEWRRDSSFLLNHETPATSWNLTRMGNTYKSSSGPFSRAIQDHFVHIRANFTVQSGVRVVNTKPLAKSDQRLACLHAVSRSKLPIRLGAGRELSANQPRRSSRLVLQDPQSLVTQGAALRTSTFFWQLLLLPVLDALHEDPFAPISPCPQPLPRAPLPRHRALPSLPAVSPHDPGRRRGAGPSLSPRPASRPSPARSPAS